MAWGNCFFHAVGRWIKRGGWLIIRRSPYRKKILHFIHADDLPEELAVSQFVPVKPESGSNFVGWYEGKVLDIIGHVKPPKPNGFDFVAFFFWASYFLGWFWCAYWIFDMVTNWIIKG